MDKESIQTGVFAESELHGHGIKRMTNQEMVLKGDFTKGILSGQKSEIETEEGHYLGSIVDGKITGEGMMIYHNGDKYDGYWLEGTYHGKGKLTFATGETFTGDFKFGRRVGKGVHIKFSDKRDTNGERDVIYNYEGDYADDVRNGYGVLKEIRPPLDNEGERYIEFFGHWENDHFNGKGRLLVYESKQKRIKFEEHDGAFKDGLRDGLGKSLKLKEADMYGDDEEFRKEILAADSMDYLDFIGDFYNDRPVYQSGVLKSVKIAPPQAMPTSILKFDPIATRRRK